MADYKLMPAGQKLLPCPFCGHAPKEYDQIGYSSVKCHGCKFSIKTKSEDGPPYAPQLWNRRAAPGEQQRAPDVSGLVEALERLGEAGKRLNEEAEDVLWDDGAGEVAPTDYWSELRDAIEAADATLAAHRKGGSEA